MLQVDRKNIFEPERLGVIRRPRFERMSVEPVNGNDAGLHKLDRYSAEWTYVLDNWVLASVQFGQTCSVLHAQLTNVKCCDSSLL